MKRFDNKATFENSLLNGINLFLGAGFSVLAKNEKGESLLVGDQLASDLKKKFNIVGEFNLSQIATILESSKRQEFYQYLIEKFRVGQFDEKYLCLTKLNIKAIFTTNIDNLVFKVYENCRDKYLTDLTHEGSKINEPASIDYSALHGCVMYQDRKLIFDVSSLNNAYSNSPRVWDYLSHSIEKSPTIFWGYGLNDSGVIQSLTSSRTLRSAQKAKWILLTEDNESIAPYYEAMGFNIIVADTTSFLQYLGRIESSGTVSKRLQPSEEINYLFGKNFVPKTGIGLSVSPISDFFKGNPPTWSNVFGGQIFKTSHFSKIQNSIYAKKNSIVIGGPVTGKTTLMMQLGVHTEYDGYKLVFDNLSIRNAELIIEVFRGRKALVFVDNLSASVDGFQKLSNIESITLLGFDRTHNYGIISHLIDEESFEFFNVTELNDQDSQGIYDILPVEQRQAKLHKSNNPAYDRDSLFEFISRNVKYPKIEKRFSDALSDLQGKNPLLTEFLILLSYVHTARIPVSFEMLYSYFQNEIQSYEDIYQMQNDLSDLVKEYSGDLVVENDQDYFYPRSLFIAETILRVANRQTTKHVIQKSLNNIPSVQIPYYNTFRKYAFDKNLISRVFDDWREGRQFYEQAYDYDFENPYVLQQGALYLSQKKKFTEAFHWIDKAITQSKDRFFSIRNSHAIILFEANINSKEENSAIRSQLDKSMSILERCYNDDKRRTFHVVRYAEQTKEYAKRYFDETTKHYIQTSIKWLKSEAEHNKWNQELRRLLKDVSDIGL